MARREQLVPAQVDEASPVDHSPCFSLRVTFCDSLNNGFVTLGGAGFESEAEWQADWNSIPAADLGYEDADKLTLDKLDLLGDIIDERPISRAVAERLLGERLDTLIERGRVRTCFTYGQFKAMQEASCATTH